MTRRIMWEGEPVTLPAVPAPTGHEYMRKLGPIDTGAAATVRRFLRQREGVEVCVRCGLSRGAVERFGWSCSGAVQS